jgi:iron complex outermembrane recepter protein
VNRNNVRFDWMAARRSQALRRTIACLAILAFAALPAWPQQKLGDLTEQSLEDLMNIQVTSVSKTEQPLSRTAAAVFVITKNDIAHSGATNIPDLLGMVPGLEIAQINGSTWAVSARGFNEQFSNKLLVMIDGRIVYTPNFAGVYWDTLDLPLEDIERIEVIRGPGGSIWGANAVNGVISIFTKRAVDTRGALFTFGGGNVDQESGTLQYGGHFGKETDYRVFTSYFNQSPQLDLTGQNGADGWHMLRGGFRTDSQLAAEDSLTIQGNLYGGREGEMGFVLPSITSPNYVPLPVQIDLGGGFFQSTWNHTYSDRSDSSLQLAFTRYTRDDPEEPETRDTLNLDYQFHLLWGSRQNVVWGLGYSYTTDRFRGSLTVSFDPPGRALQTFNSFVQDEIALVPHHLYLTVGTKLEHNDYTGFELMPSASVAWTPNDHQTLWASVSHALRAPSRNDTNLIVNVGGSFASDGTLTLTRFLGNPHFQDEHLIAYELGYRQMATDRLSVDISSYYNDYDDLQTVEPGASFPEQTPAPPHEVATLTYQNLMRGETHGVEISANWKATHRWTLSPGYALELIHMRTFPASLDTTSALFVEHAAPRHSAQLRSRFDLSHGWQWDTAIYFVDRLTHQGITFDQVVPAYTRVDTSLTWKPREHWSISMVGQNLAKDHHLEFEDFFGSMQSGQIKRSAYAKFTWRF